MSLSSFVTFVLSCDRCIHNYVYVDIAHLRVRTGWSLILNPCVKKSCWAALRTAFQATRCCASTSKADPAQLFWMVTFVRDLVRTLPSGALCLESAGPEEGLSNEILITDPYQHLAACRGHCNFANILHPLPMDMTVSPEPASQQGCLLCELQKRPIGIQAGVASCMLVPFIRMHSSQRSDVQR